MQIRIFEQGVGEQQNHVVDAMFAGDTLCGSPAADAVVPEIPVSHERKDRGLVPGVGAIGSIEMATWSFDSLWVGSLVGC